MEQTKSDWVVETPRFGEISDSRVGKRLEAPSLEGIHLKEIHR